MSTNAFVGKSVNNNEVKYIYVHWDGYPEHTGKMLLENYNAQEKVDELISMGDCSSLGVNLNDSTFYHRDREDDLTIETTTEEDYFPTGNIEYTYLFKDGIWYIIDEDKLVGVLTHKMCGIEETVKEYISGKDIIEVFDITNLEHLKEFEHLTNTGTWKHNSIFLNCKFPQMWQMIIINKLAMAYLEDKIK